MQSPRRCENRTIREVPGDRFMQRHGTKRVAGRQVPSRLDAGSLPVHMPSCSPWLYLDFGGPCKVDVIVTLDPVPPFDLDRWRRQVQALLGSVVAPRPETAAAWYGDRAGDGPLEHPQLPPLRWVRY